MKFMVDQNLGPKFADVLNALCEPPHSAHHISMLDHLGLSKNSTDTEWMRALSNDDDQWAVFTTDRGIVRNPVLSRELSESGVTYFIAMKNWRGVPIHERIARIAHLWP